MRGRALYAETYRAALALAWLEPWRRAAAHELVLLRVASEEGPVVAVPEPLGQGGRGLVLLRGPRAVERAYRLLGGDLDPGPSGALVCGFAERGTAPLAARRLLVRARLDPPDAAEVPVVLVRAAGAPPREPAEAEVGLLRLVLRGLLQAFDQGLLGREPAADGLAHPALVVTVGLRGEVEVHGGESGPDLPSLAVDRAALAAAPRLGRDWIVGCEVAPFGLEGGGVARLLVVLERGRGRLVDGLAVSGPRWPFAAASRVLDLIAGAADERGGRPRRLICTSPALAALLGPELRAVSVPCELDRSLGDRVSRAVEELADRIVRSAR